jgi:hypothetical protein
MSFGNWLVYPRIKRWRNRTLRSILTFLDLGLTGYPSLILVVVDSSATLAEYPAACLELLNTP